MGILPSLCRLLISRDWIITPQKQMCSLDVKSGRQRHCCLSLWPQINWWRRQARPRNISRLPTSLFDSSWKTALALDPPRLVPMSVSRIYSRDWNPPSFISVLPHQHERYSPIALLYADEEIDNPNDTPYHSDWREHWIIRWSWSNNFITWSPQ